MHCFKPGTNRVIVWILFQKFGTIWVWFTGKQQSVELLSWLFWGFHKCICLRSQQLRNDNETVVHSHTSYFIACSFIWWLSFRFSMALSSVLLLWKVNVEENTARSDLLEPPLVSISVSNALRCMLKQWTAHGIPHTLTEGQLWV